MQSEERNAYIKSLYVEMYSMLLSLARIDLDTDEAHDLVQQTFLIAVERFDKLTASENPRGWLTNTLKYLILNAKRANYKAQIRTVPLADEDFASDDNSAPFYTPSTTDSYTFELDDLFTNAVGADAYELYKEVYIYKLPNEVLEAKYGINIAAVRNRASRIKKKLSKVWKDSL